MSQKPKLPPDPNPFDAYFFFQHDGRFPRVQYLDEYNPDGSPGDRAIPFPGRVLVFGEPGSGKTWWTMEKAVDLAMKNYRVVLCLAEDYPAEVEDRLRGLCAAKSVLFEALPGLVVYRNVWLDTADDTRAQFITGLQALKPHVVFFDPLVYYYGGSENHAEEVRRFLVVVNNFFFREGITTVLVHHSTKPSKETRSTARGSTAWDAWADIAVHIGRLDDYWSGIRVTKRRGAGSRINQKFQVVSEGTTGVAILSTDLAEEFPQGSSYRIDRAVLSDDEASALENGIRVRKVPKTITLELPYADVPDLSR